MGRGLHGHKKQMLVMPVCSTHTHTSIHTKMHTYLGFPACLPYRTSLSQLRAWRRDLHKYDEIAQEALKVGGAGGRRQVGWGVWVGVGGDGEEGGEVKVGGAQAGRQAGGCMGGGSGVLLPACLPGIVICRLPPCRPLVVASLCVRSVVSDAGPSSCRRYPEAAAWNLIAPYHSTHITALSYRRPRAMPTHLRRRPPKPERRGTTAAPLRCVVCERETLNLLSEGLRGKTRCGNWGG